MEACAIDGKMIRSFCTGPTVYQEEMTFCPNFSDHFPSGPNGHTAGMKCNGQLFLQSPKDRFLEEAPLEGFMGMTPGVVIYKCSFESPDFFPKQY